MTPCLRLLTTLFFPLFYLESLWQCERGRRLDGQWWRKIVSRLTLSPSLHFLPLFNILIPFSLRVFKSCWLFLTNSCFLPFFRTSLESAFRCILSFAFSPSLLSIFLLIPDYLSCFMPGTLTFPDRVLFHCSVYSGANYITTRCFILCVFLSWSIIHHRFISISSSLFHRIFFGIFSPRQ